MSNAFAESRNGIMRAVKRPSLVAAFAALQGGAGNGQGLFSYSTPTGQTLVGIQNDVVVNSGSMTALATKLKFSVQPSDWKIDTAMSPSVVVTATDFFGNTISSYTGTVSIAFGSNPNGGTLSGTLSVAAVAGVATFSNLKIDKVGGGYTFRATASLMKSATSSVFKIASTLAFTVQPSGGQKNVTLNPVEVSVVDSSSATISGYTGDVTIALASGNGTLSGTLTVTAVGGVASFANLQIDTDGNYTLVASETNAGMSSITSNQFTIGGYVLVAGSAGAQRGYKQDTGLGSLTPNTFNGVEIVFLESRVLAVTNTALQTNGAHPQDFFTSITINGVTLTSASAAYTGGTTWTWTGTVLIPATGTYNVTFA